MSFPCTGCGCCCKRLNKADTSIINDKNNPLYFPYLFDETGRCEKLTNDNRCSVYNERPLVCNIDRMIDQSGVKRNIQHSIINNICNKLMDEDNIDLKFRIP